MNIPDSLKATLFHAIEIVVSLAVALAVVKGLQWIGVPLPTDTVAVIGGVVINAFLKFQRTAEVGKLRDYVNG